MAQVLNSGGILLNSDPKRMPVRRIHVGKLRFGNTNNGIINSGTAAFWSDDFLIKTSDNYAANTEKTIVNITSGSGYLTHVIGPCDQTESASTTIFKITVDGVETAVAFDSTGLGAFVAYDRICLGYFPISSSTDTGNPKQGQYFMQSTTYNNGTNRNNDDSYIAQNTNYYASVPNTALQIADAPQVCVRFETSLKVTITTSYVSTNSSSSGAYRSSGVIYLLDPPTS